MPELEVESKSYYKQKGPESWSALKEWIYGCEEFAARAYVAGDEVPEDAAKDNHAMRTGRIMHKAMETFYKTGSKVLARDTITFGFEPGEERDTLQDVFAHYAENGWTREDFNTSVLSVEEQYRVELAKDQFLTFSPDLVTQDQKGIHIWDWKFVSRIDSFSGALDYDFQKRSYSAAMQQIFPDEPIWFGWRWIRKEVPPGFGSSSILTPTGKMSRRSVETSDYIRKHEVYTPKEENDEFFQYLARARDTMHANVPVRKSTYQCHNCTFKKDCWNANDTTKTSNDGIPAATT